MILPKHEIIARGLIRDFLGGVQFQPCGVDLTLQKIFRFSSPGKIDFDNSQRVLSDCEELKFDANEEAFLPKGAYKVVYNEVVKIPLDCAALAFPRSSLLRCGVDVHCAVWDPGYEGRSESLLIVENEKGITLKKNARIIQLVFFSLREEAKHAYEGKFKGENL
ncbi:deoxyuridine 5'-triphosphate nucleotidohydrolase [Candidatus Micrarchaeota archaeon]|nr:deoxyuridine 5'-triphosphate nucleotidohydrolase [Candidatus Micrarchaeota archaeon]